MARWSGTKRRGFSPVTLALLAGWIIVIVVGAGTRPDDAPLLGVQHGGTIMGIILILLALLGLAILILVRPPDNDDDYPPIKKRQPWLFLAAIVLLFWLWQPDFLANRESEEEDRIGGSDETQTLDFDSEPAADSVAQFSDLLLIALAIGALVGIGYWARRRSEEAAPPLEALADQELQADLLVAIDDASAELALSDDPQAGVLNAYVTLERVLASHDRARFPSETPTEHVRRAVASLGIDSAPLVDLGELYALARFSEEPITVGQQDAAQLALGRARDELAART